MILSLFFYLFETPSMEKQRPSGPQSSKQLISPQKKDELQSDHVHTSQRLIRKKNVQGKKRKKRKGKYYNNKKTKNKAMVFRERKKSRIFKTRRYFVSVAGEDGIPLSLCLSQGCFISLLTKENELYCRATRRIMFVGQVTFPHYWHDRVSLGDIYYFSLNF